MPTIKFKLKDPKYCNGCPFQSYKYSWQCKVMNCYITSKTNGKWKRIYTRPQACIDKFGE